MPAVLRHNLLILMELCETIFFEGGGGVGVGVGVNYSIRSRHNCTIVT